MSFHVEVGRVIGQIFMSLAKQSFRCWGLPHVYVSSMFTLHKNSIPTLKYLGIQASIVF